jgi:adenylyl-sulfate kinase
LPEYYRQKRGSRYYFFFLSLEIHKELIILQFVILKYKIKVYFMNGTTQKATNIKWHRSQVTLEEIENRNGHDGCVVWLTGLSASGKSTIAVEMERMLFDMDCHVRILDGDNVRHGLNKDLGFTDADRVENIRRISEVSKLFRATGMIVINAFISPFQKDRDSARDLIDEGHFFEVFIKASLEECIRRDPKGIYQKAIKGEIPHFTGITSPYEEPVSPELIVNTEALSIEESAGAIINLLREKGILRK